MANKVTKSYPEGLSIVLPAFNEEGNISKVAESALEIAKSVAKSYEVIVVDDGSEDQTRNICQEIGLKNGHLKILHNEKNKGYGAALRRGFLSSQYNLVFYTDSDNQFDLKELPNLLHSIDSYDIVAGFRIDRNDPPLRLFVSGVYNLLIKVIFRVKIRDVNCAFKLFRRDLFDILTIESTDFFVDTEIIVKANRLGYTIKQIGVRHYPRLSGSSTVHASDIPKTLKRMFHIRKSAKKLKAR